MRLFRTKHVSIFAAMFIAVSVVLGCHSMHPGTAMAYERVILTNNATSRIATTISAVATSIVLNPGTGALFPAPSSTNGEYAPATLYDSTDNKEIVYITARSVDTLTVERGKEGTTPREWPVGTGIGCRLTAGVIEDRLRNQIDRLYYVNPYAVDQTDSGVSGTLDDYSLADISEYLDVANTEAEVVLPANSTSYVIGANLTLSPEVHLTIHHGAVLSISAGFTLTFSRPPVAGRYKILEGDGSFNLGPGFADTFPEWTGAEANDATVDSAVAVNKLTENMTSGGGINFGTGFYYAITEPFYMRDRIRFHGQGRSTVLTQPDGTNLVAIVQQYNYAALLAANNWLVSAGSPYGFEIDDLAVDGNWHDSSDGVTVNNTAGICVQLYGKNYHIPNIFIQNCADQGFTSAAANGTGVTTFPEDLGNTEIDTITVSFTGKEGIIWHGPHDSYVKRIVAHHAGLYCMTNDTDALYKGGLRIGMIHTFQCYRDDGLVEVSHPDGKFDEWVQIDWGNFEGGVEFNEVIYGGHFKTQLTELHSNPAVKVNYPNWHFDSLDLSVQGANTYTMNVFDITSSANTGDVGNVSVTSTGKDNAIGIYIGANRVSIPNFNIYGFNESGGIGIDIEDDVQSINIKGNVSDCETLVRYADGGSAGVRNKVTITGNYDSGAAPAQAMYDGRFPGTTDDFNISATDTDTSTIYYVTSKSAYAGPMAGEVTSLSSNILLYNFYSTVHVALGGADNLNDLRVIADDSIAPYNGYRVTLIFENNNCTVKHGLGINLTGGIDKNYTTGMTLVIEYDSQTGDWRQTGGDV